MEVHPDVISTLTVSAPEEGGRVTTDLEALARVREQRFQQRRARIDADAKLDPRIKALYLDRTPWNTTRCAEELCISEGRISVMRTRARKKTRESPHPSVFPDRDTVEGVLAGVEAPGVEAGRVREWAVQRGTHELDPVTGKLIKLEGSTHGRPRSARPSLSTRLRPQRRGDDN